MAEEEEKEKTKAGKALKAAKEGLIDLAISYLNTESGLGLLGVEDEELELFIRDKERRKEFIRENKPRFKQYEISGRLFNKNTGEPLENVKITPLLCIISGPTPITNFQGKFTTIIEIPVVGDEEKDIHKAILKSQFFYTKENFAPSQQVLINRDNTVKTDLPTISLLDLDKAAEEEDKNVQIALDEGEKELSKIFLNGVDKLIILRRQAISKLTNVIKLTLIPLAIQIFIIFGIVKIQDVNNGVSCPPPEALNEAIRKRNKIVKQLNQIYATIIINSALATAILIISANLKGIINTINNLLFPLAVPPGVGVTYAVIGSLDRVKGALDKVAEDNKKLNKQIIISLALLVAALIVVLIYLKNIDKMIQKCSQDANLEPLSPELISLREENERADATPLPSLNGFIFSVVEDKNSVGTLKRRFAVAKNKDGVILLKGEPSFSASDQILIDELKFYIQINDLKAF
jgi:hypothetical protein